MRKRSKTIWVRGHYRRIGTKAHSYGPHGRAATRKKSKHFGGYRPGAEAAAHEFGGKPSDYKYYNGRWVLK